MKKKRSFKELFEQKVEKEFEKNYRTIAGEGTSYFRIARVPKQHQVNCKTVTEEMPCNWTQRNWFYHNATHYLYFHKNKLPLVVDGIINLRSTYLKKFRVSKIFKNNQYYTHKSHHQKEILLYESVWVQQGKGTQIYPKKGYIAVLGKTSFHSTKSVDHAINGVWRKANLNKIIAKQRKETEARLKKEKIAYYDTIPENMTLSYEDSRNSGNCHEGTISFIRTHKLQRTKQYPARLIYKISLRGQKTEQVKRVIEWKKTLSNNQKLSSDVSEGRVYPQSLFKRIMKRIIK